MAVLVLRSEGHSFMQQLRLAPSWATLNAALHLSAAEKERREREARLVAEQEEATRLKPFHETVTVLMARIWSYLVFCPGKWEPVGLLPGTDTIEAKVVIPADTMLYNWITTPGARTVAELLTTRLKEQHNITLTHLEPFTLTRFVEKPK